MPVRISARSASLALAPAQGYVIRTTVNSGLLNIGLATREVGLRLATVPVCMPVQTVVEAPERTEGIGAPPVPTV
jgi:hypothetical protein